MSLRAHLDVYRYWRRYVDRLADETADGFAALLTDFATYGVDVKQARILEVGCGQRYQNTLLLHSMGAAVTGIDVSVVRPVTGLWARARLYGEVWRHEGLSRLVRTVGRHLLVEPRYRARVTGRVGSPLSEDDIDLRTMDAAAMTFPDATFDASFSLCVMEHVLMPEPVLGEIARVVKPGGLALFVIHLYPSISGGHNLNWTYPDEQDPRRPRHPVPPWDHLRENRYPSIYPLNRLRERDWRRHFAGGWDILEWTPGVREGETFLTPEIEAELAPEYDREELLTAYIKVVARPRKAQRPEGDEGA